MLLRCAALGFAVRQVGRFIVTTLSLAARRLAGQRIPEAAVLRARVRHAPGGRSPIGPAGRSGPVAASASA
jgi:hypothetical protein